MKKLPYIDFAKGICMIFIVFGHIFPSKAHPVLIYVYSFHVPAFFIISGLLLEYTKEYQKPLLELAKSNILRLLVPYICFETIYNVIYCCFNGFFNIGWLMWQTIILYGAGLATWFLPVLFASKAYLLLLKKITHNQVVICLACLIPFCFALFSGFDDSTGQWKLYILFRTCNAIGFLWIGTLLCQYIEKITDSKIILAISLMVSIIAGLENGRISTYSMFYGNPLLYFIAAVSGTLMLLCFGKHIKHAKPILFLSYNSVIVLGTHQQIQSVITWVIGEQIVSAYWFPLMLAIILLEYPIATFINRFAPFLIGKWYKR